MKVKYKCRCMKEPREIDVVDRVAGSDLDDWMLAIGHCVSYDHRARNILCNSPTMEELYIPVPEGTEELGRPVTKQ